MRKQSRRRQHWQNIVVHLASKVLASLLLPYYCMTELQSISSAKNFVPKCIPNNFWESAPAVYLLNNNIWPYYILFMFCVSYEWAFFVYQIQGCQLCIVGYTDFFCQVMKKCAKKSQVQWYTKTKSWSRAVEWNFATGYRDFSHFSGQVSRKTNVITFCGLAGSSTWLVAVAGTTLAALSLASKVMTQAATIRKPGRRNKQKLNLSKTLLRIWITLPMHHQLKKRQCKKMSNTSSYSLFSCVGCIWSPLRF